MIVDYNEINEALGIDLQSMLGKGQNNTTYVERWVKKCEDDIMQLIARYSYYGEGQAQRYLGNSKAKETIKDAIIDQAEYKLDNMGAEKLGGIILSPSGGMTTLSARQRLDATISPRAYERLMNAGLLNATKSAGRFFG